MNHNFNEALVRNLTFDEKVQYGIVPLEILCNIEETQSSLIEETACKYQEMLSTAEDEIDRAIELLENIQDADTYEAEQGVVEKVLSVLRGIDL